jgi:hypothetical protein
MLRVITVIAGPLGEPLGVGLEHAANPTAAAATAATTPANPAARRHIVASVVLGRVEGSMV